MLIVLVLVTVVLERTQAYTEMVLTLVMTTGARVHNRAGGLQADKITGKDGLR